MGEPAEKRDDDKIELPLERFERLLRALETIVQRDSRERMRQDDEARRAARKAGPTTAAERALVRQLLQKKASKR